MLRARFPVMAGKSGPITTPRFNALGGEPAITPLNQSSAIWVSSRQRTALNPFQEVSSPQVVEIAHRRSSIWADLGAKFCGHT